MLIIVSGPGRPNSQTALSMNDGYGQYILSSSIFPENEIRDVCIEDFNHDGWQDIIIVSGENEADSIQLNGQAGGFFSCRRSPD